LQHATKTKTEIFFPKTTPNKQFIWNTTAIKTITECPTPEEIGIHRLKGDGDFRSQEYIKLLKQADIVVTNPPFSLFREYVSQLMEYNKHFLIVGDQNAITYKEIFSFIKENKLWTGVTNGGTKWFAIPEHYDIKTESRKKIENGQKYFSKGSIVWFTNLDHNRRHEELILWKKYTPEEFSKYDNYNAINVNKVAEIPVNYDGYMGVPITFMNKFNPEQFEICGFMNSGEENKGIRYENTPHGRPIVDGKEIYFRILIKNLKL